MTSLWRELTSAARALRRQPVFSGSTILTLGLGLGVVTGFFAIVEAVLLAPIAAHRDTVVRVWKLDPQRSIARYPLSYPELAFWRERSQSVQQLAAVSYADTHTTALLLGDEAIPVGIAPVSAGFFQVLRDGPPLLGRWLLPSDDGNSVELAAVASERFWQQWGGGDPAFVGKRLRWPGGARSLVIVGVAPSSMTYPAGADLWAPIDGFFGDDKDDPNLSLHSARFAEFHFLARLRAGVPVQAARSELEAISRSFASAQPEDDRPPMAVVVEPLLEATLGTLRPLTLFLFAGAALVFLAAGGNVAALLIMRAAAQARDIAVRLALGAGRARIVRQTLMEAALLGAAGALSGLAIAQLCLGLARLVARTQIPRIESAALNGEVLGFCIGAALLWVVTLGVAPIWYQQRVDARGLTPQLSTRTTRRAALVRHRPRRRGQPAGGHRAHPAQCLCDARVTRSAVRAAAAEARRAAGCDRRHHGARGSGHRPGRPQRAHAVRRAGRGRGTRQPVRHVGADDTFVLRDHGRADHAGPRLHRRRRP
jgi:hypothetical protein